MRLGLVYHLFRTEAAVETDSRIAFNLLSRYANPAEVVFQGVVGLCPDALVWRVVTLWLACSSPMLSALLS